MADLKSVPTHYAMNESLARRNRTMKRRARRGWDTRQLAQHYGMSQPTAWRIVRNPNSGKAK